MKIDTFLESLPVKDAKFRVYMEHITDIWSNTAAAGYAIQAMQTAGIDRKTICKVLDNMRNGFEDISVPDAERIFRKF